MALTQISTAGVKDDAVTAGKIPANAVGSSELADNAVDTAAIANNAVTETKLATDSVSTSKIIDTAITAAKLASGVQTTINNNADNRVITGSGTANTLEGEANLTWDATTLKTEAANPILELSGTAGTSGNTFMHINANANHWCVGADNYSSQNNFVIKSGTPASSTHRFAIDSSGKVGIGETSIDALLVIKGASDASTTPSIRLKDGTDTREAWISNTSGDLILANGGNDNTPHCMLKMFDGNIMQFNTANTERMRIDQNGQLLLGTTTANAYGNRDFTIARNAGDFYIEMRGANNSNQGLIFSQGSAQDANSYQGYISYSQTDQRMGFHADGGTRRVSIDADGLKFNSDTAAANALDDYEEGSFSPTVASGGTASSYTHQYGYYIKIGRMVHWQIYLSINGSGSSSQFQLGSFPFTAGAYNSTAYGGATVGYANNTFQTDNLYMYMQQNNTTLMFVNRAGQAIAGNSGAIFAGSDFILFGQYVTA